MGLPKLAVKRPITILMITLAVLLLGFISLTRLPIDLLPNLELPVMAVSVNYQGVGPQEIESLISIPLEESIGTVNGIESITTRSSEGNSILIAQFAFGTDMSQAALELREKVDTVEAFLPEDASSPIVLQIDPDSLPIIQIALTGTNDLASLQVFADEVLSPNIERLDGVASVDISGGYSRKVEIIVDPAIIHSYGLTFDTLASMISAENINLPGGTIKRGNQEYTIRTLGEFKSLSEIENLRFMLNTGQQISLGDVAQVRFIDDDQQSIVRANGQRSLDISVNKQSGTNTVNVARNVLDELDNIVENNPQYEIVPVLNQAEFIELSIDNLLESALLGSLFAFIVLFLFFRSFRTTSIIAIAIPISVISTFVLLYFSNITLNLMTLGGLALAIGMLVDNAIVVLENIFRFREEGVEKEEAAVSGASEVSMAITASTITTIAVFLPIVFVEGITSEIFRELALTIALSLLVSLVVALSVIPMLSSRLIKRKSKTKDIKDSKFIKIFDSLKEKYVKLLRLSINNPGKTILSGVLIFILAMSTIFLVGTEYFPEVDQGQFTVSIDLASGTSSEKTEDTTIKVENMILDIPGVETVYSTIGKGSSSVNVTTDLSSDSSSADIADILRKKVEEIAGADIDVSVLSATSLAGGGMGGAPVSIAIKGDNLDKLENISQDFISIISQVDGTRMVSSSFTSGVPEVQIKINRLQASQYGLTTAQVANSVRTIMTGTTVTRYNYQGSEIDVIIKGMDSYNQGVASLNSLLVSTPTGSIVPLSEIANISLAQGPTRIEREDQVRVVTVSSQIYQRDLGSISEDIEALLDEYDMPNGYTYQLGGEYTELVNALEDLTLALVLSIILVYMVLASQFESFLHPFIIMFAVPLSFSGGALGLFVTGNSLNVPSMIGAIMLAGIVVNDAIVLVDYINTRRKQGEEVKEAIMNAGPIRLRPILITTLTTALALIPLGLGLGEGGELLAPMGIAVIFGISLATLLTLVFIPALYLVFDNLANKLKRS
ncbi:MAG: efflux RND transporter permease subunit [Clostridia bacterium]